MDRSSKREALFQKLELLMMSFFTTLKGYFPEFCSVIETNVPVVMYECAKYYTIFESTCKKHGIDKFISPEKPNRRIRMYYQGQQVAIETPSDLILYDEIKGDKYQTIRCETLKEAKEFKDSENGYQKRKRADNVSMLGLQCYIKATGRKYDLDPSEDLYYEGNRLLDSPMVRQLMMEQHKITMMDNEEYECAFINEDMNVMTIDQQEYMLIEDGKCIIKSTENVFKQAPNMSDNEHFAQT